MTERKYMDVEDLDVLESSTVISLSEACTCHRAGASCLCERWSAEDSPACFASERSVVGIR